MANIYDKEEFFAAYAEMDRSKGGLAAAGEWQQFEKLFPDLQGKDVLDLGCGYGWHCKYAVREGAASVLGIDGSEKMLHVAETMNGDEKIAYKRCGLETYSYPENAYDVVISNLALHYVEDLGSIYQKVYRTLRNGGCFLFNIEHPVFTAGINQDWVYDENGTPRYWAIDNYYYPGKRMTNFLGHMVEKQHHTLTQILNLLLQTGFQIEVVEEVIPPQNMMHIPGMADEMRRPMMLLVKAIKKEREYFT